MDVQAALKSQYHAALTTLRLALERCPEELWERPDQPAPFWQVAYHTLFFVHFYLQPSVDAFEPWDQHVRGVDYLASAQPVALYSREQLLEYWRWCDAAVDAAVDAMDLGAPESGFPWYPMSKLEHQLVNLRHAQHHAAVLGDRVRQATGTGIGWVGAGAATG